MHRKRYNYCMYNVKCILSTMSQYIAQKHTSLQIISIRNIFFHMIIKDYKYSHLMFIITYYVLSIMKKMWTLILWLGTTNQLCRYIFHIRCWQVFTSNMCFILLSLYYTNSLHIRSQRILGFLLVHIKYNNQRRWNLVFPRYNL